ncbi:MAG: alpha/beta hydrolase [Planctomycetes bacterium]|nr:alpha/beta hydrolase [Planctomycetota bacterium]
MSDQYVICARAVHKHKGEFVAEPGKLRYLKVPPKSVPKPEHELEVADWAQEVRDLADGMRDGLVAKSGDVLIFVHGYNNDIEVIRRRQMRLQKDMHTAGWKGIVISFDWPSDDSTLNYYEDRGDAAEVAHSMVTGGISVLARGQADGCQTNVHLLGHSTGAFVIMEAFAQAEKYGSLFKSDWRVAQVAFIGGDVSSGSLAHDSQWARPMFDRCMRLTNYTNGFDHVLAISNAKRLGVAPRAGRVGLPADAHSKAADVDCSQHFQSIDPKKATYFGTFAHSWHIGDPVFALDLSMTLEGRIDRNFLPTRAPIGGKLVLQKGKRPAFERDWHLDGV